MMVPLPINILTRLALENCLNPVEFVAKIIINALKALEKTAAAAVLVGLLLMYDPNYSALAASGGRMGGSSFSSRSSTSSSRSKTTPRMGSWSAEERVPAYAHYPSWSSISSSRSYTRPRMGPAYYFSYSVPYSAPSLFGGVDVDVALFVFAQFVLVFGLLYLFLPELFERIFKKTSVLKLQVGLLGLGRSLQKDLNRIAETADTSTSKGLNYVLTETVLALLRYPDYCISAYSSVDVKRSMEEAEKRFNQLSIEERGKFDEETLVNFNNIKKQSSTILRAGGSSNKYIVITILVAAEGGHKPLCIKNSKDLKEALQKLASIPSSRTLAVEVLWTPQDEDDTLSERQLLEDYPLLRPL